MRTRRWAALAAKEATLLLRDRAALAFVLLGPIVVITAAGLSLSTFYGTRSGRPVDTLLPIVDEDGGAVAEEIVRRLQSAPGLRAIVVDADEARRLVAASNRAGAALRIPSGTTEALRRGEGAALELWTDPVKHLEVLRIRGEVERVRAALVTAHVAARIAVVEVLTYAGDADFETVAADAAELARRLAPSAIALRERSLTSARTSFNTFDQNVPGFAVTFLLLGMLLGVGLGLVDERQWGLLDRLAAAPVGEATVVVSKVAARFVVGAVQMALLFAFGRLAFAVSLGPSLLALALVVLGVCFAGAAFGLLVAGLAPSRDAVLPLGTVAIVTMAAVGGCWWPLTIEPPWLQRLAHAFPTAWAMGAFNDLMLRERGLDAVAEAIAALGGFGAAYLVLGAWLFLRREAAAR